MRQIISHPPAVRGMPQNHQKPFYPALSCEEMRPSDIKPSPKTAKAHPRRRTVKASPPPNHMAELDALLRTQDHSWNDLFEVRFPVPNLRAAGQGKRSKTRSHHWPTEPQAINSYSHTNLHLTDVLSFPCSWVLTQGQASKGTRKNAAEKFASRSAF